MQLFRARAGECAAGEDPVTRVAVAMGDRTELVVMAAGAAEREPKNCTARGVDRILEGQMPELKGRRSVAPRKGQKPSRDYRFSVALRGDPTRQQITR